MALLRRDPTVAQVIPRALGDAVQWFRMVGTEPSYPRLYGGRLAAGRMFAAPLEAVIGAEVARQTGLGTGRRFGEVTGSARARVPASMPTGRSPSWASWRALTPLLTG